MSVKKISSLSNPEIIRIVKLQRKSSERKKLNRFVVEGVREVSLALQTGVKVLQLFICPEIFKEAPSYPIDLERYDSKTIKVTTQVYSKVAYRTDSEGIMLVASRIDKSLTELKLPENPLLIVLEKVEKPGNLGAILRTCDAVKADAVVVCDPKTDIYNPNVIRSGLGCLFTNQVVVCSTTDFIAWANKKGITLMLASLQTRNKYFEEDMTQPLAMVFGTEANGLSEEWYNANHTGLKIPMLGKTDSLNVSVSVAVLAYEAIRQRITSEKK